MSEYTENSKRLLAFLKDHPFLFRSEMEDMGIADYLKWFEYRNKKDFSAFPALLTYDAKIIELYKDKVVNSMFLPLPNGAMALHTIVQLSPTCHLIFVYASSEDKRRTLVYCTVYSTDSSEFFKFIDEASPYVTDDERRVGFRDGGGFFGREA